MRTLDLFQVCAFFCLPLSHSPSTGQLPGKDFSIVSDILTHQSPTPTQTTIRRRVVFVVQNKLTTIQQVPNTSAHQLTNSRIHQLINSKFHRLTNSLTHQLRKLKLLFFILQYRSNFHFVLARILARK